MLRTVVLASILSLFPLTAHAQPPDVSSSRWQRYAEIVEAQQAKDTARRVIVETDGTEYALSLSIDGQSVSYADLSGYVAIGGTMRRLAVVSVSTFNGDAWCRILSANGKVLSEVSGGASATCSVADWQR